MNKNKILYIVVIQIIILILAACNSKETNNKIDAEYLNSILAHRNEKDSIMHFGLHSPFNRDTTVEFSPLKYYEADPAYLFKSKLFRYDPPDTVEILGTLGEIRQVIKEGFVKLVSSRALCLKFTEVFTPFIGEYSIPVINVLPSSSISGASG